MRTLIDLAIWIVNAYFIVMGLALVYGFFVSLL